MEVGQRESVRKECPFRGSYSRTVNRRKDRPIIRTDSEESVWEN
jgi:hypothetical protein